MVGENGMKKRIIALITTITLIAILATIIWWNAYGKYEPRQVFHLPSGFIPIAQINTLSDKPLNCVFLEEFGNIIRTDENRSIAQFDVKDTECIVKYKGQYYINQELLEDKEDKGAVLPSGQNPNKVQEKAKGEENPPQ